MRPANHHAHRTTTRAAAAVAAALAITSCGTSEPKLPPKAPLATPNTAKYPGLTITGPPMAPDRLAMIDAVAKRDYMVKTMREKAPASYAPLTTVMTPEEAKTTEKELRDIHAHNGKSTGWEKLKVLSAGEFFGGAVIKFCADGRGWKLVTKTGDHTDVYINSNPKIRTVTLTKSGSTWVVSQNDNNPAEPGTDNAKACSK
jgi:hypothetical protein